MCPNFGGGDSASSWFLDDDGVGDGVGTSHSLEWGELDSEELPEMEAEAMDRVLYGVLERLRGARGLEAGLRLFGMLDGPTRCARCRW